MKPRVTLLALAWLSSSVALAQTPATSAPGPHAVTGTGRQIMPPRAKDKNWIERFLGVYTADEELRGRE